MDKAPDYESGDWGFESLRGCPSVYLSELPEMNLTSVLVEVTSGLSVEPEFQIQATVWSSWLWLISVFVQKNKRGLHGCDQYALHCIIQQYYAAKHKSISPDGLFIPLTFWQKEYII